MKNPRAIGMGIVAVIAVGFFIWLTNSYVLRSDANQKKVIISGSALTSPDSQSQNFAFTIAPEPGQNDLISGVDLHVEVENGTLAKWDGCSDLEDSNKAFTELINTTGATARYSCVILKDAKELSKAVSLSGQATCAGTQPMKLKVLQDKTDVVGPVEGAEYAVEVANTIEFSCDGSGGGPVPSPEPTEDMITSFNPKNCDQNVGGTCIYDLDVKARNDKDKISGLYIKIGYDSNVLDFVRLTNPKSGNVQGLMAQTNVPAPTVATTVSIPPVAPTSGQPGTNVTPPVTTTPTVTQSPTVPALPTIEVSPVVSPTPVLSGVPDTLPAGCGVVVTDDQPGQVSFIYICDSPADKLSSLVSLPMEFAAIGNGSGTLRIEAVQITGPQIIGPYSVHLDKGSYSIGGGAGGNLQLNMKLRMQCVVNKPRGANTMQVKVGLADGGLRAPIFETATFKADDKGFWNGTVTFNAPAGPGYKLLPKGEKHMQKKVCVNGATEDYPGAYSCDRGAITLQNGNNDIDLSQIVLLSGDLPPGEQDGISNAKDQSLVRNLIGKKDAESVGLADINYDGVVNAVDHSCLIAALSVRWDEE